MHSTPVFYIHNTRPIPVHNPRTVFERFRTRVDALLMHYWVADRPPELERVLPHIGKAKEQRTWISRQVQSILQEIQAITEEKITYTDLNEMKRHIDTLLSQYTEKHYHPHCLQILKLLSQRIHCTAFNRTDWLHREPILDASGRWTDQ